MLKYTLPDFTVGLGLNLLFIRLLQQRPELFQHEVAIDSVYGCFPGCVMNGGRAFNRQRFTVDQMEEAFGYLQEYGVKPRLTFTNMLAQEEHLHDEYSNAILDVARRFGGEAIVYSDLVASYVQRQYDLPCVLSTTRAIEDVAELNAATKRYDYVVLNYNCHKDEAFLAAIEDKSKVEVMVNEFCAPRCPHRQEHYAHNSEDQMTGVLRPFTCIANKAHFFDHAPGHPVMFTSCEVRSLYEKHGVSYFKIVGRGVAFQTVLEAYVHYLVKPPYRDQVKQLVMKSAG